MSSLTSIGINKNKKSFAPKNNRRKKPAPAKEPKSAESTTKSVESTLKSTLDTQATLVESSSTQRSVFDASQATFVDSTDEPMEVDAKAETLTQEELAINTRRKRRHAPDEDSPNKRPDTGTSIVPGAERFTPQLKEEAMTPHFEDVLNDDDVEYKEDVEPKEEELNRSKELLKKNKGKKPATQKKKTTKKSKSKAAAAASSSSSKGTAISIGIGIPGPSTSETAEEPLDDREYDGEPRRRKEASKKRHKFAYRLVENMKTLDDITNDPASVDSLEKPMSHFTKDIDGIVSKAFKEMEQTREEENKKKEAKKTMTEEELEELKKKEEEEERAAAEKRRIEKEKEEERRKDAENHVLQESSNAVQVRIVNGEIVLDTDTLVVERQSGGTEEDTGSMEVVEETNLTRKVNSGTYGKRKKSSRWDLFETATFYEYLSQFGTDFEMISKVMPGRTRNQIRLKFNREEKTNPEKITEYLITKKKPMDLEKFKEVANIDLEAVPDDFHELQLA